MILKFVNGDGGNFQFSNVGNYFLLGWSGFGDLPIEHKLLKSPYQDGKTLIESFFNERPLSISFTILGANRQEIFDKRLEVSRYFNPKLGLGYIEWTQDDGTSIYRIDCISSKIIFADGKGQGISWQDTVIEFIAPNPFWYNPTSLISTLVGFSGGLSFPISFPLSFGTVTSQITVINSGNVNTPIILSFIGEVTDPVLENITTDKKITIVKNIPSGSTLIINTAFGNKSVKIYNGITYANAFEYVDPDSEFWELEPGDNVIKYSASFEGPGSSCTILYYNRYSGV